MPLSHADNARLAHRVLRLKENAVADEAKLRKLAGAGLADEDDHAGEGMDHVIGANTRNPLGRLALATYDFTDEDRPGPTDAKAVERLMGMSLTDIHKAWDESVTANLEETLPDDDLRAWRESVERDQRRFEEKAARMQETGDWPVHPRFGHMRHAQGAANALYDEGREGFLVGAIDWDTAVFKVVLVDSADYSVNLATHEFLSSVASAAREETSGALANKTFAAGVADADDITFTAASGDPCEALIIVQSSAVTGGADVADTAQRLVGYIDTATGLPVTLNGGNVNVVWESGANRIFKL